MKLLRESIHTCLSKSDQLKFFVIRKPTQKLRRKKITKNTFHSRKIKLTQNRNRNRRFPMESKQTFNLVALIFRQLKYKYFKMEMKKTEIFIRFSFIHLFLTIHSLKSETLLVRKKTGKKRSIKWKNKNKNKQKMLGRKNNKWGKMFYFHFVSENLFSESF